MPRLMTGHIQQEPGFPMPRWRKSVCSATTFTANGTTKSYRILKMLFLNSALALLSGLTSPPFVALASQQLPIDRGDLLQVIFHLVVVLNPTADLLHLIAGDDSTGRFSGSQGDRQIPYGAMPLPLSALTSWVAAGHISFDQRSTQGRSEEHTSELQ